MNDKHIAALRPQSYTEIEQLADRLARSGLTPSALRGKPDDLFAVILHGLELGLGPAASVQNIAMVDGKPAVYGDMMIALVRGSFAWDEGAYDEWFELDGERLTAPQAATTIASGGKAPNLIACCQCARRGGSPQVGTFSVEQARTADLWVDGKGSRTPWSRYPIEMLLWKARARVMRRLFADVLKGTATYEDLDQAGPGVRAEPPLRRAERVEENRVLERIGQAPALPTASYSASDDAGTVAADDVQANDDELDREMDAALTRFLNALDGAGSEIELRQIGSKSDDLALLTGDRLLAARAAYSDRRDALAHAEASD
jgi:hypothetical protein